MTAVLVVSWLEGTLRMIGSLCDVTLGMPFGGWLFFLVTREWHAVKLLEFFAQLQALKSSAIMKFQTMFIVLRS